MILVDERVGSRDLHGALERQGVPVALAHLDYCDFAFVGRGIEDEPITVGIELKRIHGSDATKADLITSLRSGRLAGHQLGGMQSYDRAWLVTEGLWRGSDAGALEVYERGGWVPLRNGRSTLMMRDIESELLTIVTRGGVGYWHCPTARDTVRFIATLYHWWTAKALDEHRSHEAIYLPPPDRAVFIEPSAFVKMIFAGIKGLGYDKALAIESHFGGDGVSDGVKFERLSAASIKDLRSIAGIGTTLADRLYHTLHDATVLTATVSDIHAPTTRRRKPRETS